MKKRFVFVLSLIIMVVVVIVAPAENVMLSTNKNNDVIIFDNITMYDSVASIIDKVISKRYKQDPNPFSVSMGVYIFYSQAKSSNISEVVLHTNQNKIVTLGLKIKKGSDNFNEIRRTVTQLFGEAKFVPSSVVNNGTYTINYGEQLVWEGRNARITINADVTGNVKPLTIKQLESGRGNFVLKFDPNGEPELEETSITENNTSIIKLGSNGEDVLLLQEALQELGYNLETNGKFDGATYSAVFDFQKKNNLEPTGIVTPEVLNAIFLKSKGDL